MSPDGVQRYPHAGDTYLILDRSLSTIVKHLQKGLEGRIRINWPVSLVEYFDSGVLLHGPAGEGLGLVHCNGQASKPVVTPATAPETEQSVGPSHHTRRHHTAFAWMLLKILRVINRKETIVPLSIGRGLSWHVG